MSTLHCINEIKKRYEELGNFQVLSNMNLILLCYLSRNVNNTALENVDVMTFNTTPICNG